jgi:hypothetical protein
MSGAADADPLRMTAGSKAAPVLMQFRAHPALEVWSLTAVQVTVM